MKPFVVIGKTSKASYHAERRPISNTRQVQQRQWPGTKERDRQEYICLLKAASTCLMGIRMPFQTVSQAISKLIPKPFILCVIRMENLAALLCASAAGSAPTDSLSMPAAAGPRLLGWP